MFQRLVSIAQAIAQTVTQNTQRLLRSGRILGISLIAIVALSGCVDADVGIQVDSPSQGSIVQHIKFDDRFSSLTSGSFQTWLFTIEQRARQVNGKARRLSNKELLVTIPFTTTQDLEQKFNQFFSANLQPRSRQKLELPNVESHLKVEASNLLLIERRKFIYDIDLSALGVATPDGENLVNPNSLLNLSVKLNTPWGARNIVRPGSVASRRQGNSLIWTLQPGQKNHLEAAFWMPNGLGIGTLFIVAIITAGTYFQQSSMKQSTSGATSATGADS